ncbi:MAG TPA: hypothetical protein VGL93_14095 [Streptosporangiaceae bacterium]
MSDYPRRPGPGGTFRITETPEGDLDVLRDGAPAYRPQFGVTLDRVPVLRGQRRPGEFDGHPAVSSATIRG